MGATPPASWATTSRARDSHLAQASGQHDRCTAWAAWAAWAAWVTVIDCQPLVSSRPGSGLCVAVPWNAVLDSRVSRTCASVPQPCEGRCWSSPSESRSP